VTGRKSLVHQHSWVFRPKTPNDCGHGNRHFLDSMGAPSISMGYSEKSNDMLKAAHSSSLHFTAIAIATARSASRFAATIVAIK
jgi:hypothetical protein